MNCKHMKSIIAKIQFEYNPKLTKTPKRPKIKIKSTVESRQAPNIETTPNFRARRPSAKSVPITNSNRAQATGVNPWLKEQTK